MDGGCDVYDCADNSGVVCRKHCFYTETPTERGLGLFLAHVDLF